MQAKENSHATKNKNRPKESENSPYVNEETN